MRFQRVRTVRFNRLLALDDLPAGPCAADFGWPAQEADMAEALAKIPVSVPGLAQPQPA